MFYADYKTERAHAMAAKTLASFSDIAGYPVSLDVARMGTSVTISGLAPAAETKEAK